MRYAVDDSPFYEASCVNNILQWSFRLCNWLSLRRLVSWINHLPPACWSTFWKSIFKQQLGCRCDIKDSISYFLYFDICNYICFDTSYHFLALSILLKYFLFFQVLLYLSSIDVLFTLSICYFNSLRPRQNRRHFENDVFKCNFLNGNVWILIRLSLKFVPKGPISSVPELVQKMAWRRTGDKPSSEPITTQFNDANMRHSASMI